MWTVINLHVLLRNMFVPANACTASCLLFTNCSLWCRHLLQCLTVRVCACSSVSVWGLRLGSFCAPFRRKRWRQSSARDKHDKVTSKLLWETLQPPNVSWILLIVAKKQGMAVHASLLSNFYSWPSWNSEAAAVSWQSSLKLKKDEPSIYPTAVVG